MTDDNLDRCNRNERKIDSIERTVQGLGDKLLKIDIKLDNIVLNDLRHKAEKGNVLLFRSKRDIGVLIAVISGISLIISSLINNMDTIIRFLTGG